MNLRYNWLRRVRALVIKETLAVLRDPKSRFILIGPPLIELILFSYAATQEVKNIRVAIYDQDGSLAARELVSRFAGSRYVADVWLLQGLEQGREAIDRQDAVMVLNIGPTFGRDLSAGRPASVQCILDGRRANAAQIVLGYAGIVVSDFATQWNREHGSVRDAPGAVLTRAWFNPNLSSLLSTVPSLVGIIATLVGLLLTALSVARERELGTFEQLLVSPLNPWEILLGKTIPAIVLGLGEGLAMALVGKLLFHLPFEGSPLLLGVTMFLFLLAIIGVGLLISSLAKTQQQAILGTFAFMLPAILLSGFATPVENMPAWLQAVTYLNPVRYFLILSKGVFLEGMGPMTAVQNLWPMAIFAVFSLWLAAWMFRSRLE